MITTNKNRICLCLNAKTLSANLAALEAEAGFDPSIDFAELRLDCLLDFSGPQALSASLEGFYRDLAGLPAGVRFVLTLRKVADGGLCPDSLGEYTKILERCMRAFPDKNLAYLDLDAALLEHAFCAEREVAKTSGTAGVFEGCVRLLDNLRRAEAGLLVSVHHFGALPKDLALKNWVGRLKDLPDRLPKLFRDFVHDSAKCDSSETTKLAFKLALTVSSSAELLRFYRFAQQLKQNQAPNSFVLLAMGEFGSSTRVLRPHIGSLWSFCCPGKNSGLAEPLQTLRNLGQISLSELIELYNYRNIGAQTRIYGVVGNPVRHSRSPEIHNPVYRERGWDAVYLRFCVDSLIDFLALGDLLPIFGISVTVPHKEHAARLAEPLCIGPRVKLLGAANTLYRSKGCWFAENTDVEGFLRPLREFCQSLSGRKAAIIGAGGSARAVACALLQEGMNCEVYNRTEERAQELQRLFSAAPDLPGRITQAGALRRGSHISKDCLLIVQCTSLGMYEAESPIPDYVFEAGQIAYDLIYRPALTAFLKQARREGACILNGAAMLEAQAQAQIRLFGSRNN